MDFGTGRETRVLVRSGYLFFWFFRDEIFGRLVEIGLRFIQWTCRCMGSEETAYNRFRCRSWYLFVLSGAECSMYVKQKVQLYLRSKAEYRLECTVTLFCHWRKHEKRRLYKSRKSSGYNEEGTSINITLLFPPYHLLYRYSYFIYISIRFFACTLEYLNVEVRDYSVFSEILHVKMKQGKDHTSNNSCKKIDHLLAIHS